jgi:hypothetical protein
MANPAESEVQNLLPVQAYFDVQGNFQTFIGQGKPFYATANPSQSGLNITNSTINSTTIGAITPSTGVFTNIATTTGTISTAPTGPTDIANKQYVDFYAAGLSWKQPVATATSGNITRSGLQTINGVVLVAGDRVLVKDQSTASENGIYVASATAWTYAVGADDWDEYIGAIVFVVEGSLNGTAWFCTAQPGGTLGVTAMNWSNFSVASSYTAGTGLTLTGTQFSITNTGVSAATYGSASSVPVVAFNAQGQATSVTNTNIAINGNQITSGTVGSSYLSGTYSGITGLGTLLDLTVTNAIVGSITGNAATATLATSATSATTATNLGGGASGNVPYQTASGTTTFLATGSNGQVLTLASGVPSWATPTTGTVTSVSGAGTVNGLTLTGTVTTSGSLTLGGTLDLSSPPTIGNTAPNTGRFTTLTVNDNTTLGSSNTDTVTFTARINSDFDPATDNAYDLGRTGHEWRNLFITGTANIDSLVADTADINAGTIDNTVIGGTTPLAGTFTDLRFNNTLSLAGSTGTAGYVVTSNGASAPTWQALPASGITITDDTTTNATRYLAFTSATSGSITGQNVSSTKLQFNPSTGAFTATSLTPTNAIGVAYGGTGATTLAGANIPVTNVANTFTGLQTFAGTSSNADLKTSNILETATISATAATGTIAYDVTTQSVLYYTSNASGDFTLNFRGSSGTSLNTIMSTGESLSVTFLVTNGSTAYYNSALQIDGSSVTPKWQGGTAPTSGSASAIDAYTYVIFKTGSAAFTVLASVTKFA